MVFLSLFFCIAIIIITGLKHKQLYWTFIPVFPESGPWTGSLAHSQNITLPRCKISVYNVYIMNNWLIIKACSCDHVPNRAEVTLWWSADPVRSCSSHVFPSAQIMNCRTGFWSRCGSPDPVIESPVLTEFSLLSVTMETRASVLNHASPVTLVTLEHVVLLCFRSGLKHEHQIIQFRKHNKS